MAGIFSTFNASTTFGGIVEMSPNRGRSQNFYDGYYTREFLTSDQITTITLTLTHVIPDSAIRIEYQQDSLVAATYNVPTNNYVIGTQAGDDLALQNNDLLGYANTQYETVAFTIPVYSVGYYKNNLRIKVRNASNYTTPYKSWETLVTVVAGTNQSIYVNQESDK